MTQNLTNLLIETESLSEMETTPLISSETNYTSSDSSTNILLPNNGTAFELPIEMQFNDGNRLAILVYTLLILVSAVGNIYVFTSLVRRIKNGKFGRIHLLLLHLTIADLLVTFVMIPLEISWNYTVSWHAGDLMCRLMSFFRTFGLYLDGFLIVVISLDLYFAVATPLEIAYADKRAKIMLAVAWTVSFIFSLPQSIIFHVETHPEFTWYQQCITFNIFPSRVYELAYNMLSLFFLHVFPMSMLIICYSCVFYHVYRANKKTSADNPLRRSNTDAIGRARIRTLKTTVTLVATFFFCWTPYNITSLWYWFGKSSQAVDPITQKLPVLLVCTNYVLNPFIYGFFHFRRNPKVSNNPVSDKSGQNDRFEGNETGNKCTGEDEMLPNLD